MCYVLDESLGFVNRADCGNKILPAVLGKIVDWRGFPADDRTDC